MKKGVLQLAVIVMLIVVIPAISWVYLKNGLSYRLDKRSELVPIKLVNNWEKDSFDHKYLVLYSGTSTVLDDMDRLQSMFDDRPGFVIVQSTLSFPRIELEPNSAQLIDSVGQVLHEYNMQDEDIFAQLARHLVYLAPVEKRKDFEFRRKKES